METVASNFRRRLLRIRRVHRLLATRRMQLIDLAHEPVPTDLGRCAHIVEGPVPFIALRNLPPSFARAWVGYLAPEKRLALAALVRLIRQLAREHAADEDLPEQIASALVSTTEVWGVAVRLEALHLSTRRLPRTDGPRTSFHGLYLRRPLLRRDFIQHCWIRAPLR